MEVTMFTDGGARGNPGPAAIGVVIKNHKGDVIQKTGKYIGESTNNDAEYRALLDGVTSLKEIGATKVKCFLDSELVVKQMNGLYKVKNQNIKTLWGKIKIIEKSFEEITYHHVKREKNMEADSIVNEVLDSALIK
jgi:ribonuclease HI